VVRLTRRRNVDKIAILESMGRDLTVHLRRARDHADRRYAEQLDLAALAEAANVSKFHFARCFAQTYGETPMRYLTRRRIERAQDLLRTANLTVTEISGMVGYQSLGSFTTRFTALVGVSPAGYRQRWATSDGHLIPGCFLFMRGLDPWPEKRNLEEALADR
jgi:AraC-like DNA-binding protein